MSVKLIEKLNSDKIIKSENDVYYINFDLVEKFQNKHFIENSKFAFFRLYESLDCDFKSKGATMNSFYIETRYTPYDILYYEFKRNSFSLCRTTECSGDKLPQNQDFLTINEPFIRINDITKINITSDKLTIKNKFNQILNIVNL